MKDKKRILTITNCYLPAYKSGGPIRTLANMVEHLGEDYDFLVITGDRDAGDRQPFAGYVIDGWNDVFGCRVLYLSPGKRRIFSLRKILASTDHDLLYLNSLFSSFTIKILLLRRCRLLPAAPVIIAPRGEFSRGALGLKYFKKKAFIVAAKIAGLYRNLTWQASSEHEKKDIEAVFPGNKIFIAPNLPPRRQGSKPAAKPKQAGEARFVFLSRIARKKNLRFALELFKDIRGAVVFDIYGPPSDDAYLAECRKTMGRLPENINCRYMGTLPHDRVHGTIGRYHFFLLPTLGENFGHVIIEALSCGCPVIISDQTFWRGLEAQKVGWDIPLENSEKFAEVIQKCVDMEDHDYQVLSGKAHTYGLRFVNNESVVEQNRALFQVREGNLSKNISESSQGGLKNEAGSPESRQRRNRTGGDTGSPG